MAVLFWMLSLPLCKDQPANPVPRASESCCSQSIHKDPVLSKPVTLLTRQDQIFLPKNKCTV